MHQELAAAVLSPGISTHRATVSADLNQRADHGPKAHHAGKSKNCGNDYFFHLLVPFQADAALSKTDLRCLPQRVPPRLCNYRRHEKLIQIVPVLSPPLRVARRRCEHILQEYRQTYAFVCRASLCELPSAALLSANHILFTIALSLLVLNRAPFHRLLCL